MAKTGSQVLRDAVKRLDGGRRWAVGAWRRKVLMPDTGEEELTYCILGSLGMQNVEARSPGQKEAVNILCEVAREQFPRRHINTAYDLMCLNDQKASPHDIVALVEKAYVRSLEPTFDDVTEEE